MVRLSSRAKTTSARGMARRVRSMMQLWVTMVDDDQLQARVHQRIHLAALAVGNHGDLGIGIQPGELEEKGRLQYVIAKRAKT